VTPPTFPVLLDWREKREEPDCPAVVPWALVEPWRTLAWRVHAQSLERLAERGGLSPVEMWGLAHGVNLWSVPRSQRPTLEAAVAWLVGLVEAAEDNAARAAPPVYRGGLSD